MKIAINGEPIPEEAVEYELRRLVQFYSEHMTTEELKAQLPEMRKKAIDQVVGAKLLMMEADRLDIQVSPDDVSAKLAAMKVDVGGEDKFQEVLKKQNINESQVVDGIKRGKRMDKLIEQITQGLDDPTEQEIEEHFDQNAEDYFRPERVQAQHILLKPASDKLEDRETSKSKLMELRNKIQLGEDFADVASQFSECPSGKKSGGSLGWFARGMMIPEFDDAVFAMELEELSDVVETPLGFHLIKLNGYEEGGAVTLDEVADKVRDFLRHATRGRMISAYVEELKGKAEIDIQE